MNVPVMDEIELDDIVELSVVKETYPNLGTENQWRARIYNRESNGLIEAKAIIKLERRWWIVMSRYRAWLASRAESNSM